MKSDTQDCAFPKAHRMSYKEHCASNTQGPEKQAKVDKTPLSWATVKTVLLSVFVANTCQSR